MKRYTLNVYTQQGAITYAVEVPSNCNLAEALLSDEPLAVTTTAGNTLIVQGINAVAIEIVEEKAPPVENS
jgi:hypothetical protein